MKQTDMHLSALRGNIEAMGGQLDVVTTPPDRGPVKIRLPEDVTTQRAVETECPVASGHDFEKRLARNSTVKNRSLLTFISDWTSAL